MKKKPDIDPKLLLEANISIERDLSIMTGPELVAKYATGDRAIVFRHVVGKSVAEMALEHNPFWHYALQTWYRKPQYRSLLYPPRHRDEVAKAVLMMAT